MDTSSTSGNRYHRGTGPLSLRPFTCLSSSADQSVSQL